MRLTILGSSASFAGPGQATAGHLIEADDGTAVLLDCGSGVIANLQKVCDPSRLAAVFITHAHPDHWVDVYALQAMLRYDPNGTRPPLDLHLPRALFETMQSPLGARGARELAEAFRVSHIADRVEVVAGGTLVTPYRVDHVGDTFALGVAADGVRVVYTADTGPGLAAAEAAHCADLLLAEATLPERYAGAAPHLTARQAGELGKEAGAGQLVLTHIWPTNDREQAAAEAVAAFGGPVSIARELDTFEIAPLGCREDFA